MTVTHPRTKAARRHPPRPAVHEIDEETDVGDLLVRSLVRAQLGLALRTVTALSLVLGGLPLLFALVPNARSARLFGVPLPWLTLGLLAYPLLVGLGAVHVRLAQRHERDFVALIERSRQ
ncbi:MAG TPA: hypothetical protein VIC62_18740 [Nakamurella sp.]|nr:hypothetical protein [Mycobacteriales bacterium]